jgi:hypothetical protein
MTRTATILFIVLLAGGCARYEHEIVRPEELSAHIPTRVDTVVDREPLEYRFRTVDNRLVMRIYNLSDDPITLLGEESSVVDPTGQSRPLRSQTIAPQSFIRLILPPPPPRVQRVGPSIGIGVGTRIGHHRHGPYPYAGAHHPIGPAYFRVVDDDAYYWDWPREGQIRLMLILERERERFRHEWVIGRVKM